MTVHGSSFPWFLVPLTRPDGAHIKVFVLLREQGEAGTGEHDINRSFILALAYALVAMVAIRKVHRGIIHGAAAAIQASHKWTA
jgi:hypothetical protein